MGIWDFGDYATEDLEEIKRLLGKLAEFNLPYGIDPDGIAELDNELEERRFKLADFELTYEQEDLILEEGLEKWRERK